MAKKAKKKASAAEIKKLRKAYRDARKAYFKAVPRMRVLHHVRRRRLYANPAERRWRMWDHDFDTLMHGLARNPAAMAMAPEAVVDFASKVADAMSVEQDKRNPKRFDSFRY